MAIESQWNDYVYSYVKVSIFGKLTYVLLLFAETPPIVDYVWNLIQKSGKYK